MLRSQSVAFLLQTLEATASASEDRMKSLKHDHTVRQYPRALSFGVLLAVSYPAHRRSQSWLERTGVWSSFSIYAPWHIEGGKRTTQKVVKFQMRPSPLAK